MTTLKRLYHVLFFSETSTVYFLGGYGNGTWSWVDSSGGEPINDENGGLYWDIGEPSGDGCVAVFSDRVLLRAVNCGTTFARFVCSYMYSMGSIAY